MDIKTKKERISDLLNDGNLEWKDFEKILLTIVGATLAASVTFFTASKQTFTRPHWLKASWTLLSLSLFFLMLSYLFSEIYSDDLLTKVKKSELESLSDDDISSLEITWLKHGILVSNLLNALCALLGLISLTIFGWFNIN